MTEPTTATILPFATPARPQAVALATNELHAMATSKLADALTPGFQAEFSPFEAQLAGAFLEDALPEADAMESTLDLLRAIQTSTARQP